MKFTLAQIVLSIATALISACAALTTYNKTGASPGATQHPNVWLHENVFAWAMSVDAQAKNPEARAAILKRLDLNGLADFDAGDAVAFDAKIKALHDQGIKILAWAVIDSIDRIQPIDWRNHPVSGATAAKSETSAHELTVGQMLETFKRYGIAPQLWVIRPLPAPKPAWQPPRSASEWTPEDWNESFRRMLGQDMTSTPEEQARRVRDEAHRLKPLAELAAPYGISVGFYKHGGWLGVTDNQIAVIEQLKGQGIRNVGIVYAFMHAHDEVDDTSDFPAAWKRLKPHVLTVIPTGVRRVDKTTVFPVLAIGRGDLEVQMMKTIQDSGWKGPIGVHADQPGNDAETTLQTHLAGLDVLAAQLDTRSSAH